jgi:hypothetical protein
LLLQDDTRRLIRLRRVAQDSNHPNAINIGAFRTGKTLSRFPRPLNTFRISVGDPINKSSAGVICLQGYSCVTSPR